MSAKSDRNLALVARAQAGDRQAMDELLRENAGLVRGKMASLKVPSVIEFDDLAQAGLIGLWRAASKFRTDEGAAFTSYACVCIRNALLKCIERETGADRTCEDGEDSDRLDEAPPPPELPSWAARVLSPDERELACRVALHGQTLHQISQQDGKSLAEVTAAWRAVKARLCAAAPAPP